MDIQHLTINFIRVISFCCKFQANSSQNSVVCGASASNAPCLYYQRLLCSSACLHTCSCKLELVENCILVSSTCVFVSISSKSGQAEEDSEALAYAWNKERNWEGKSGREIFEALSLIWKRKERERSGYRREILLALPNFVPLQNGEKWKESDIFV